MSYGIHDMNPGPSLNPREPDWNAIQPCYFCQKGTKVADLHRIACSDCDGACPDSVVYTCWPCSEKRVFLCLLCEEIEATGSDEE